MRHVALAALALVAAAPSNAHSQNGLTAGGGPAVHLEVMKPFFDTGPFGDGFGFATSILDATLVVPISSGPALFGRIGLAHATLEALGSSSVLSNARVGVLLGGQGSTRGEVHVDLSTAEEFGDDDYAAFVALMADFERIERFVSESWAVGGSITRESVSDSGLRFGGRLGGTLWMPSAGGSDDEVFATYAGFVRFPAGSTQLGAELSGLVIVSEDGSFGERNSSFLTVSMALPEVAAAPEAYVRVPLDDDISEALELVLGVRVRFGG